jgi:hypothetical protein
MHHILVGLRAFAEAVFWGLVGGGAYGVILGVTLTQLRDGLDIVLVFFVVAAVWFGLVSGVVTGVVGMIVAGAVSALGAAETPDGRLGARVVSAVVSGTCVTVTCWWLTDSSDVLGSPSSSSDWVQVVVIPGLAAALVGAWRAGPILTTRTPTLVPRGT